MKIKFCGAAETVTGSCHLVELDSGKRILLDCGLYQGSDSNFKTFNDEWKFDPSTIDALILSHAHIDHSGRIPKLVKDGFKGEIYCTNATRNLCRIMLADSAFIQEREAESANKRRSPNQPEIEPLYTSEDVHVAMQQFIAIGYDKWFQIDENLAFQFRDAGHILGSATVTLQIVENQKRTYLGYTGDIGRSNRPILKDPKPMPKLDYLICESTYGDRLHLNLDEDREELLEIIYQTCVVNKGKLIIPAFSIGRTQEIVYLLNQLEYEGRLPKLPVFVDSPLAINATNIYLMHPECYDDEIHQHILEDENPFGFSGLKYTRHVQESKAINHLKGPAIIISASGMMTAGRIRHHLYNKIEDPKNTILVVGFNAPGTLGRILVDGAKSVKLRGEVKQVKAKIKILNSFSAHADQKEMIEFLSNQDQLKELFLVHGENKAQLIFKKELEKNGFKNVSIPALFENVKLV
ncbi:MAG: MBL fold metallo-hydrolase [Bacteroidota bacterium]